MGDQDQDKDRDLTDGGKYQKKKALDSRKCIYGNIDGTESGKYQAQSVGDARISKYQAPVLETEAELQKRVENRKILLESEWQRELLRREREAVIEQQRKDRDKERENTTFSRYNQTVQERVSEEGEAEGEGEADNDGEEEVAGNDTYEKYESYGGEAQTSNSRNRNRESEFDDDLQSQSQEGTQMESGQEEAEMEDALEVEWASSVISKAAADDEEDGQCEGEADVEGDALRSGRNHLRSAHTLVEDAIKDEDNEEVRRLPESSSSRQNEGEQELKSHNSKQDYPLGIIDNIERENDYRNSSGLILQCLKDPKESTSPLENSNDYEEVIDCHIDGCENEQSQGSMMSRDIYIAASKS